MEKANYNPILSNQETLLDKLDGLLKDVAPNWSDENADPSADETKYCLNCDFLPAEDYDKCECVIKNELRQELRNSIKEIRGSL